MQLKNLFFRLKPLLVTIILLVLGVTLVTFLFPAEQGSFIDPTATVALVVTMFILGVILKMNYTSALFIIDLLLGVVLVSLLNFTQGFLIILVLLFFQKRFRVL